MIDYMTKPKPNDNPTPAKKRPGPKSLYRPEYTEIARRACQTYAATDMELADLFGISTATVFNWKIRNPEFAAACAIGKAAANERVINALFHRAVGHFVQAEKVFVSGGRVRRVPVREYFPPDVGAIRLWLVNRLPAEWRDKQQDIYVKDTTDPDKPYEVLMYELMRDMIECGAIELKDGVELLPPGSVEPRGR
jgi:hypothetical protein